MLAIRLQRTGRRHQPAYRIVVAERRSKRGGPPVEDLGFYNPFTKEVGVDKERISYWIGVGAKPTATTHNLLVKEGVVEQPKVVIPIRERKKEVKGEETQPEGEKPPEGEKGEAAEEVKEQDKEEENKGEEKETEETEESTDEKKEEPVEEKAV